MLQCLAISILRANSLMSCTIRFNPLEMFKRQSINYQNECFLGYLLASAALLPLFRRRTLLVCSALGMAASNAAAAALAAEGAAVLGARASAAATALALCLFVLVRNNFPQSFDLNL